MALNFKVNGAVIDGHRGHPAFCMDSRTSKAVSQDVEVRQRILFGRRGTWANSQQLAS